MLDDLWSQQAALALPPFVLTSMICFAFPRALTPVVVLAALYAVEAVFALAAGPVAPMLVAELADGSWLQLKIPTATLAIGYVVVWARQRVPLFPPGFRTNLRILLRRPGVFARKYWPGLSALLVGAGLDAATTIHFMVRYGVDEELHPAMRAAAQVLGPWAGVICGTLVRLGFVLIVAALWRRWCRVILWVCAGLYLLAAGSNAFGWLGRALWWMGWV